MPRWIMPILNQRRILENQLRSQRGGGECADNPVVQFHKLQIGYYGDVITNAKLVAKSLIALGNEGVIEAYLITLSYLPVNRTKFSYIASRGAPRTEYQPIA